MITDQEANVVYIADTLETAFPVFYREFCNILNRNQIPVKALPGTRDIWCRDYMPVQVGPNKFAGYIFDPDYLKTEPYTSLWSDNRQICAAININPEWHNIVLDGGNIVRWKNKVILTDKIYRENPGTGREELRKKIAAMLQADDLIIIPKQPFDFTGHADGMIRFLDENTVLLNNFSHETDSFRERLMKALKKHKLEAELLPYGYQYTSKRMNWETAHGTYINYLHIGNVIVLPVFWMMEDEQVVDRMRQLYPEATIETINANGIAEKGGVISCLTWPVLE